MDKRGAATILEAGGGPWTPVLAPLSLLYGAAAALHRGVYRRRLRARKRLPRPVVSVGNIAVGGGGKTPLVQWLADGLSQRGLKVAVLSRGYGRAGRIPERVPALWTTPMDWQRFGDEPLLLAARLPETRVYVGADRWSAGCLALSEGEVDLFVLDDGFSHHVLERDFDLVAVDDHRRFGNRRLLPWGILREPVWRLSEADVVVVTKAGCPDRNFAATVGRLSKAPVAWSGYRVRGIAAAGKRDFRDPSEFADRRFLVFSGIADPASFEATVCGIPLRTVGSIRFHDHHPYSAADLQNLRREAEARGADALLTTEKDAVRWPGDDPALPCFMVGVDLFFHEGGGELVDAAAALVGGKR